MNDFLKKLTGLAAKGTVKQTPGLGEGMIGRMSKTGQLENIGKTSSGKDVQTYYTYGRLNR